MFRNCLIRSGNADYTWNFNLPEVLRNLDSALNVASWEQSQGLFPGRATMIYPETSQYVFTGTNTIPMYKTFPKMKGFNQGIFSVPSEDSPNSSI